MDFGVAIVPYFLSEALPYAALCGFGHIALRFVRAYEQRGVRANEHYALAERVRMLEDVVDQVEDRVDRSDEVHRFTTSVLAGRANGRSQ